jgi:bile acid:Na+ symporter, BASS family
MAPQKVLALVLLISLMLQTGLQVDRADLASDLKNVRLLGRALIANVIVVPILGVILVRLFHVSDAIAVGIVLMTICPGVPFVVLAGGAKKGGDPGFAVALAFLLPVVSVVTVPITARFAVPGATRVETGSIFVSLVLYQLLPLLAGMVINNYAPKLAARFVKPLGIVLLAIVILVFVVLGKVWLVAVPSVYGTMGIFTMLLIVVLSAATGWLLGGPERKDRRTLSAGTTLRNPGLAAVIATTNFGGGVAEAAVMTYLLIQFVVVTILGTLYKRAA